VEEKCWESHYGMLERAHPSPSYTYTETNTPFRFDQKQGP